MFVRVCAIYNAQNGEVMGATIAKYIQRITSHDESIYRASEMKTFLLTYRSIMEQQELIAHLLNRFNTPPWLPEQLDDFESFSKSFLMPMRTRYDFLSFFRSASFLYITKKNSIFITTIYL